MLEGYFVTTWRRSDVDQSGFLPHERSGVACRYLMLRSMAKGADIRNIGAIYLNEIYFAEDCLF